MDRRKFLKISLAATAVAAVSPLMASPLARLMEDNNSKTNTVMTKKMILLNASPRKNRNTAQMLESGCSSPSCPTASMSRRGS